MAETSAIEWTDATWNVITGCQVVSPGCTNCYAMKLAGTRLQHHPSRAGLTTASKAGPVWNGQVRFNRDWLRQPLQWTRPRKIFVCAHGDLFADGVEDAWLDQIFAVMALRGRHTFQVLTKRPQRMRAYLSDPKTVRRVIHEAFRLDCEDGAWMSADHEIAGDPIFPLPNVWLGVSVEDQVRADERIPELLETPAAVRFLSVEPLLGPVDLTKVPFDPRNVWTNALTGLDWVIAGGESGQGARPMHPAWIRKVRDDTAAAGVAFFFKQWGMWAPGEHCPNLDARDAAELFDGTWHYSRVPRASGDEHCEYEPDLYRVGKKAAGRILDGATHSQMPA